MPQGLVTGVILVGCEPESGTRFPVGESFVVCTFTTSEGRESHGTMTVTVDPADTGIVVAAPEPVTVDTPVQLVATLAPDTAAGTVQFRDANGPIGDPVTVDPNGTATLTHTFASTGDHQITAEFVPAPDSGFAGSTSEPVTVTSQPGPAGSLGSAGSADIWNLIFGS